MGNFESVRVMARRRAAQASSQRRLEFPIRNSQLNCSSSWLWRLYRRRQKIGKFAFSPIFRGFNFVRKMGS
jgi:hypothetical protein